MLELLRDNPVKSASSAVAVLAVIVAAAISVDDRYAHAADVVTQQSSIVREVQINRLSGEIGLLELQIRDSRNRMLDTKDAGARQRYAADLDQLQTDRQAKQRTLEQIKAGVPTK